MGTRTIVNPEWEREVREWTERTCAEQGVPVKVTDPVVLRSVAILLGAPRAE